MGKFSPKHTSVGLELTLKVRYVSLVASIGSRPSHERTLLGDMVSLCFSVVLEPLCHVSKLTLLDLHQRRLGKIMCTKY